jgi:hypothetical protein
LENFKQYPVSIRKKPATKERLVQHGLYAESKILNGHHIIEYIGVIYTLDEYARAVVTDPDLNCYVVDYNGLKLTAKHKGNKARFINHSCSPNAAMIEYNYNNEARLIVVSLRQIKCHEEITIDYRWGNTGRKTKCTCGSSKCRKYLEIVPATEQQPNIGNLLSWILPRQDISSELCTVVRASAIQQQERGNIRTKPTRQLADAEQIKTKKPKKNITTEKRATECTLPPGKQAQQEVKTTAKRVAKRVIEDDSQSDSNVAATKGKQSQRRASTGGRKHEETSIIVGEQSDSSTVSRLPQQNNRKRQQYETADQNQDSSSDGSQVYTRKKGKQLRGAHNVSKRKLSEEQDSQHDSNSSENNLRQSAKRQKYLKRKNNKRKREPIEQQRVTMSEREEHGDLSDTSEDEDEWLRRKKRGPRDYSRPP